MGRVKTAADRLAYEEGRTDIVADISCCPKEHHGLYISTGCTQKKKEVEIR